jgi:phosphatidylserine/phosphatidylglycerophosphate/cardiolipin synthase-like enzyme
VGNPENGYFHAKGASFRGPLDDDQAWGHDVDEDTRPYATVAGSPNFTSGGHQNNIELNLTSQDRHKAEAFEERYNQWANAEEFSGEIIQIIENSEEYQDWKEPQEDESGQETSSEELGTYLEPTY